jgi:hypothetical protein
MRMEAGILPEQRRQKCRAGTRKAGKKLIRRGSPPVLIDNADIPLCAAKGYQTVVANPLNLNAVALDKLQLTFFAHGTEQITTVR